MANLTRQFIKYDGTQAVSALYDAVNYLQGFANDGTTSTDGITNSSNITNNGDVIFNGKTQFNSNNVFSGASTFSGNVYLNGNNVISGPTTVSSGTTLTVNGDIISNGDNVFSGNNSFTGPVNMSDGLQLTGQSSLGGTISMPGTTTCGGTANFTGNANFSGTTGFSGSVTFSSMPTFSSGFVSNADSTINGNTKTNSLTCVNKGQFGSLEVSGQATFNGNIHAANSTFNNIRANGSITAGGDISASRVYGSVFNDYAEFFPREEDTEPGDIISLDIYSDKEVYKKAIQGDKLLVGVHSEQFGHLIGGETPPDGENYISYNLKKYIPVGLAGRVKVKVVGRIEKGDKITASMIPGVGKRAGKNDQSIGYALEDYDSNSIGYIKMKIM